MMRNLRIAAALAASSSFWTAPALAEPAAPALTFARIDRIPPQLDAAQAAGYRVAFAAIREGRWQDAQIALDATRPGPLHAIARAELYLAKGSPRVELEPIVALLNEAPELPEADALRRIAAGRGAVDLPPTPAAQRLIWRDGAPRRVRAKATASDLAAADLAIRM